MFVNKLTPIFYDETAAFNDRIAAGIMLVATELAILPMHVRFLKKDCLNYTPDGRPIVSVDIPHKWPANQRPLTANQRPLNYLCSPKLEKTLKELLKLRQQSPRAKESPYLLAPDIKCCKSDVTKPIRVVWLCAKFRKFFRPNFQLNDIGLYMSWKLYHSNKPTLYIEDKEDKRFD